MAGVVILPTTGVVVGLIQTGRGLWCEGAAISVQAGSAWGPDGAAGGPVSGARRRCRGRVGVYSCQPRQRCLCAPQTPPQAHRPCLAAPQVKREWVVSQPGCAIQAYDERPWGSQGGLGGAFRRPFAGGPGGEGDPSAGPLDYYELLQVCGAHMTPVHLLGAGGGGSCSASPQPVAHALIVPGEAQCPPVLPPGPCCRCRAPPAPPPSSASTTCWPGGGTRTRTRATRRPRSGSSSWGRRTRCVGPGGGGGGIKEMGGGIGREVLCHECL